jgi:hypothetical protein
MEQGWHRVSVKVHPCWTGTALDALRVKDATLPWPSGALGGALWVQVLDDVVLATRTLQCCSALDYQGRLTTWNHSG